MVWRALSDCSTAMPGHRVRAYGEMVDLLCSSATRAAIRLEELWHDACEANSFSLLCAYAMGHFYKESDRAQFVHLCRMHSHVIPTEVLAGIGTTNRACARSPCCSSAPWRSTTRSSIAKNSNRHCEMRCAIARVEDDLRASVRRERERGHRPKPAMRSNRCFSRCWGTTSAIRSTRS